MAYGDRKTRKTRSRGWTKADKRRYEADQRRARKDRERAAKRRKDALDAMTQQELEQFLANEKAEQARRVDEMNERQEDYARKLKLERERDVADGNLMTGYLQSEIASAVARKESYGHRQGEWLDDPVSAMLGAGGFGEEVTKSVGIKLQVHLCLDCSNSMVYNRVDKVSVDVMRAIYIALDAVSKQLPDGSLTVHLWKWAIGESGKGIEHVTDENRLSYLWGRDKDDPRGPTALLPSHSGAWSGEDTWIYPLLERLEDWESLHGDPGAYRLDIIISDGVLEHKTDAPKGDKIQDRRDGNLQTIVLNFLPMSEWSDYRVPNRCVQYPATAENLLGLMRGILGDWLVGI